MDTLAIATLVDKLQSVASQRDAQWAEVSLIRQGKFHEVAPQLFDSTIPKPIVANDIDVSARYFAGVLSAAPSVTCTSASLSNESKRKFHDKRTIIVNNYLYESGFDTQMIGGADHFNTLGAVICRVVPDKTTRSVRLKVVDPIGCYWVNNQWHETVRFAKVWRKPKVELEADYPALRENPAVADFTPDYMLEVVQYEDASVCVAYLKSHPEVELYRYANMMGACSYEVGVRPGLDDTVAGSYRDVIWLQVVRHKLNQMMLKGIDKAINAPIGLPEDADTIEIGDDTVMRSASPERIRRVDLSLPSQAFAFPELLAREQGKGSMTPEALTGNVDASIITGQGVKQLQQGWNDQIAVGQRVLGEWRRRLLSKALKIDETLFAMAEREIKGIAAGIPYSIKYVPRRDIDGDYTVDVTYGYAAGLDPNRAMILLSQMYAAGWLSKESAISQMNLGINAVDELRKVSVDKSREAILNGVAIYAQSMGQTIAAGGDAAQAISQIATFVAQLNKGVPEEEAAAKAFAPPPQATQPEIPGIPSSGPDAAGGAPLPPGVQPGTATEGPGGRPDLATFFSGLTGSGQPNLSSTVARQIPA